MSIKTHKKSYLIIFIIITGSVISGCLDKREPYYPIEYEIIVETNDKVTVYLPILLDLPNNTVADLVKSLKVKKSTFEAEVTYEIIETVHGKALLIDTTGNVTLNAVTNNNYYNTHPEIPLHPFIPGNENNLKFFDMSMRINETNSYWAYLESENSNNVKVQITCGANVKEGGEYWTSQSDGSDKRHYFFSLKQGWQSIGIRRSIIYY